MERFQIVIATSNRGKIKELNSILKEFNASWVNIISQEEYNISEPEEPYETFMENAIHKAKYYATFTRTATLSEDAGFCIEALDNFPGLRTKEFTQKIGGINNAFNYLKDKLETSSNNKAYFNCAAALYLPDKDYLITCEEKIEGIITFPPRGENGFGYDPIFIPNGYNKAMAELETGVKNKISHRAKAVRGVMKELQKYLSLQKA